ncbi:MAG: GNAT family N-acetyltransferase [Rhizobiaceae bacterium]|nr:GNAT family N-acetyltransferase [Rhizobiaceae bacterium]
MQIRTAAEDDPAWVVSEHGRIYAAEFGFDAGFERNIAGKMEAFIAKDDAFKRLWIAEVDACKVGSIAISRIAGDTAFLNFVLVDPACRGRGIAGAMMDTALSHARANGFPFVRLETYSVLKDARALYAKRGFRIVETTTGVENYGRSFDVEFWAMHL